MTPAAAPEMIAPEPTRKRSAPTEPRRPKTSKPSRPKVAERAPAAPPILARMEFAQTRVSRIRTGYRPDDPSVRTLARSIRETGLITPILVDTEMNLIDGYRRLMAAKELGLVRVPTITVDMDDPLLGYVATHGRQRGWNASEKYAIAQELLERAKDPEWRESALGGRLGSAARRDRLDEFAARHVGLSRESLRKIRLIHERAREDRERFGDLARDLDRDGKVDRHFKEMQRRVARGEAEAERSIVVAPEWTELPEDDLASAVRELNLAARGDSGCVLLVPAPTALVGEAVRIVSLAGFRWLSTLAGSEGEVWLVGVLGRKAEIPIDVMELLAEGCAQGAEGAGVALEAALGAMPLKVALDAD